MAEMKRNATGNRVATPKTGTAPTQDSLEVLSTSIGARIKVTTIAPHSTTLEGTLFTACPILNVLALNTSQSSQSQTSPTTPSSTTLATQPGDYHVIPISKIQNLQVITAAPSNSSSGMIEGGSSSAFEHAMPQIIRLETKKLQERADARVRKLQDEERKRGPSDVGPEGQAMFNALDRMYSTRWHDRDIIVNDSVIIAPPYTADTARAPKDKQQSLVHIRKILEGERRKMADRAKAAGNAAAMGASMVGSGPRKGG